MTDNYEYFPVYSRIKEGFARRISMAMSDRTWDLLKVDDAKRILDQTLNEVADEEVKHLQQAQRAMLALHEEED